MDCAEDTHAVCTVFDRWRFNGSSYAGVLAVSCMMPCEFSMKYLLLTHCLGILLSTATADDEYHVLTELTARESSI